LAPEVLTGAVFFTMGIRFSIWSAKSRAGSGAGPTGTALPSFKNIMIYRGIASKIGKKPEKLAQD
jgi:hypothetical protein